MNWQPILTAPRDGSEIFVVSPDSEMPNKIKWATVWKGDWREFTGWYFIRENGSLDAACYGLTHTHWSRNPFNSLPKDGVATYLNGPQGCIEKFKSFDDILIELLLEEFK